MLHQARFRDCGCTTEDALAMLQEQTSLALNGDDDARAILAGYIEHYLARLSMQRSHR